MKDIDTKLESSQLAAISASSVSPVRELIADDWVVEPYCVHTKEEHVWLLQPEVLEFIDSGITINKTRTLPVTKWKFILESD